jgi:hypothetical protein
MYLHAFVSSLR